LSKALRRGIDKAAIRKVVVMIIRNEKVDCDKAPDPSTARNVTKPQRSAGK
jgi:hypothetical protein